MKKTLIALSLAFVALPLSASAATLSIVPSKSTLGVGDSVTVRVSVNAGGTAINNAEGVLWYSTDLFEAVGVSKGSSIFSLWITEPSISNGSIAFNGGVPSPGFSGTDGTVFTLTLRAKKPGNATLSWSDTAVRANDGQGTDVLTAASPASLSISSAAPAAPATQPAAAPEQSQGSAGDGAAPIISSDTNPDPSKWYADASPSFSWTIPSGVTAMRLLYDEKPDSAPTVLYSTPISSKTLSKVADGTHYLHVQFKYKSGWGQVAHFRFNVDATPPQAFKIVFPHSSSGVDPQPIILFNTTDALSGIDHYDVKVGTGASLQSGAAAQSNPYALPAQDPGNHEVMVTAYDTAGNSTEESAAFTVEGIDAPKITEYPTSLAIGDLLRIRGTSYPNATVEISVINADGATTTETAKANGNGEFGLIFSKRLVPGSYSLVARATDLRSARSALTEPLSLTVKFEIFNEAVTFVANYFIIAVVALLAIAGIAAVGIWSAFKLMHLTRSLRSDALDAETMVHRSFALLRHDVETHMRRLKRAKKKRNLTDEELLFLEQFEHDLKDAEHIINDEIKEIRRKK